MKIHTKRCLAERIIHARDFRSGWDKCEREMPLSHGWVGGCVEGGAQQSTHAHTHASALDIDSSKSFKSARRRFIFSDCLCLVRASASGGVNCTQSIYHRRRRRRRRTMVRDHDACGAITAGFVRRVRPRSPHWRWLFFSTIIGSGRRPRTGRFNRWRMRAAAACSGAHAKITRVCIGRVRALRSLYAFL